ncbi:RagB/SusD family nutrient uptake outer membrane protein [Flammeovirga aprica]|uniref:RagB/SusD family nutrient uptake outer membrane protein n=1 Tax=Flammeovirga aprica JL-4 TaxID=694437 RepID=A0A7X9P2F5_9BACT|nr:RagB/SusD family nutrient uptake outer membrane protein [Flammeovirga aprica]NME67424.1 RagB/SusD family nutrient uptake outer membrane protein [Flammeovirga aprica JL-4]
MKFNYKKGIISAFLISSLFSCGEKFLEHDNLTEQATTSYYRNAKEINEALTAGYSCLTVNGGRNNATLISTIMSDDCFGGGGPDDLDVQAMDNFQNNAEDKYLEIWEVTYKGIFRVNTILDRFEDAEFESVEIKNQLKGEAHFLRAFFYFRMAKLFGGVPLVTSPEPLNLPKASSEELYAQIASDMKLAIELLPAQSFNQISVSTIGHATKWAAEGLMARIFLFYTGKYNKSALPLIDGGEITETQVKTWIDDCVKNSGHDLNDDFRNNWPYAYAKDDYTWANNNGLNWVDDALGNKEVVFSIKYSVFGANDGTDALSYSNQMVLYMAMRGQGDACLPFGNGWGWGTVNPELVAVYEDGDPRKDGSIIHVDNPEEEIADDYTWGQWDCYHETGYWNKKYTPIIVNTVSEDGSSAIKGMYYDIYGNPDDFQTWNIQDEVVLRFSDVLLMAAELGVDASANLNRVRSRVGLGTVDPSLENIKLERRRELAFEGVRYYDLLRWGDAGQAINSANGMTVKNATVDTPYEISFRPETNGFLPIPESQIRLSAGVLTQNEGW